MITDSKNRMPTAPAISGPDSIAQSHAISLKAGDRRVSKLSVFSDAVWDFTIEMGTITRARLHWDAPLVDGSRLCDRPGFLDPIKEFCYAHITGRVTYRRVKINSLRQTIKLLKPAVEFYLGRGRQSFEQILPSDHDAFLSHLREGGATDQALRCLAAVQYLYRADINNGIKIELGEKPSFGSYPASQLIGRRYRRGRRQTDVIPDDVLWLLFNRCVEYLEKVSPCLLALKRRFDEAEAEFIKYPIDDKHGKRRPSAPGHLKCLFSGRSSRVWSELIKGIELPQSDLLRNGVDSPKALRAELGVLRTACFILLGLVTGMRDQELDSIEEGCLSETKTASGNSIIWVTAILRKSARAEKGIRTKWVCGPYGQLAVTILEALTKTQREVFMTKKLFVSVIRTYAANRPTQRWTRGAGGINSSTDFGTLLRRFEIRRHDGSPWNLHSHQMRRTFIRMVVRYGNISLHALQLHCKHINYHMTDYYVGADLGLWLEFQEENENMKRRILADLLGSEELAGVGGRRMVSDLNEAIEKGRLPAEFRGQAGDAIRLRWADTMLRGGKRINFHTTNICDISNSSDSKCNPAPTGEPIAHRCQPALCANSKIGPMHIPVWKVIYRTAKEALADPSIKNSAILREPLRRELENARKVLAALGQSPD